MNPIVLQPLAKPLTDNSAIDSRIRCKDDSKRNATDKRKIIRPIQYLGSKLNVLEQIVPVLELLTPQDTAFLDLFAGTTVVGQAMLANHAVISNDSMNYAKIFGDVLIVGPENLGEMDLDPDLVLKSNAYKKNREYLFNLYSGLLQKEDAAVSNFDELALAELNKRIPHCWDSENSKIGRMFDSISYGTRNLSFPAFLLTGYYAGTYFGLRQSIELDSLLYAIDQLDHNKQITKWQAAAFKCCALSCSSDVVNSAGKHFAQPLQTGRESKADFANGRCLEDRNKNVIERFNYWTAQISDISYSQKFDNYSLNLPFESIVETYLKQKDSRSFVSENSGDIPIGVIYADPPYTAQQYSRFYHILESMCLYDYPQIQLDKSGQTITKGIYRKDRHYSPFCRKSTAPEYFGYLFKFAKDLNAILAISYSVSRAEGGNPRMVKPDDLYSIAKDLQFKAECYEIDHEYRPFNSLGKLQKHTAGREYLFTFKP